MPCATKHTVDEQYQLEKSFRHILIVFIKLILLNAKERPVNWPALNQNDCVSKFVYRNAVYARLPKNPVYRQQPIE